MRCDKCRFWLYSTDTIGGSWGQCVKLDHTVYDGFENAHKTHERRSMVLRKTPSEIQAEGMVHNPAKRTFTHEHFGCVKFKIKKEVH
jgi:hypothetical protein